MTITPENAEGLRHQAPIELVFEQHDFPSISKLKQLEGLIGGYLDGRLPSTQAIRSKVYFLLEDQSGTQQKSERLQQLTSEGFAVWDALLLSVYGKKFGMPGDFGYAYQREEFIQSQDPFNAAKYTMMDTVSKKYPGRLVVATEFHSQEVNRQHDRAFRHLSDGNAYVTNMALSGKFRQAMKAYETRIHGLARHIKLRNVDIAPQIADLALQPDALAVITTLGAFHRSLEYELTQLGYTFQKSFLGSGIARMTQETLMNSIVERLNTTDTKVEEIEWLQALLTEAATDALLKKYNIGIDSENPRFVKVVLTAQQKIKQLDTQDKVKELEAKLTAYKGVDKGRYLLQALGIESI